MTNSLALLHVEVNLCRLEGAVNLNLGIQIMSTLIFLFFVFVKWASMLFVACSTKLSQNKQTNKQTNNKAKKNEEIEHDEIPYHLKTETLVGWCKNLNIKTSQGTEKHFFVI